MKLKQSSLDFYSFVSIYKDEIENSFIKKIYQTGSNEFLFQLYRSDLGRRGFFVSLGKGIGFYDPARPEEASAIAMHLRKNLSERRITSIEQINFDRVIRIVLHTGQEIIFELFREGNLIITGEGKITYAINQREWKNRKIIKGESYVPPTQTDPLSFSDEDLKNVIESSKATIVQTLATRLNLGGEISEELVFRLGINKNTPAKSVAEKTKNIRETLSEILKESTENKSYYYDEDKILSPVELKHLARDPDRIFNTLNEGFAYYFEHYPEKEKEKTPLERRIESQKRSIEEFKRLQEDYSIKGTLIISNLKLFGKVIPELNRRVKEEPVESISNIAGLKVNNIDPAKKKATLTFDDKEVSIDYTKSPGENANLMFNLSKDYKNKILGAEQAIMDTRKLMLQRKEEKKKEKRPKQWFEVYHWFVSSEGFLVIAGRDAKSNERIVKRHLKDNDIYVHADVYGAPSTIIKVEKDKELTETTLREAAIFAVSFSRAWGAGITSGSAYWVYPSQVSKTPESGEFVSTGSWIVRGKRNYLFNLPLELEISLVDYKNTRIPMITPSGVPRNEEEIMVKIAPGNGKRSNVAKKIAEILRISQDEIESILPSGGSRIVED